MAEQPELTAAETAELILHIRLSREMQLSRLGALVDGARLAAEQVQDVRLTLLEEGPDQKPADLVAAALVTVLLESSVAGFLAGAVTQTVIRPLLGTAAGLARVEHQKIRAVETRITHFLRQADVHDRRAASYAARQSGSTPATRRPGKLRAIADHFRALAARLQQVDLEDARAGWERYNRYVELLQRVAAQAPAQLTVAAKLATGLAQAGGAGDRGRRSALMVTTRSLRGFRCSVKSRTWPTVTAWP